jgi:hypothetical protein
VQVYNSSYASEFSSTPVGPWPVRTNDSESTLDFLSSASTEIRIGLFGGSITTDYVGTTGAVASFTVESEPPVAGRFNNITRLSYAVDGGAAVAVPLGSAGQNTYSWVSDLPQLPIGAHNFTVNFSDAQGFTFLDTHEFWVIGNGSDPVPAVAFTSPSPASYLDGLLQVSWISNEATYLRSETLSATSGAATVSFNVSGSSSFNLSLDEFASRSLILRIDVENVNGLNGSAATVVYVTHQFFPSAQITFPSNGSTYPVGSLVTVGFVIGGDYVDSTVLTVRSPNGTLTQANVSGTRSYTVDAVAPGNYTVGLEVGSSDGAAAWANDSFSAFAPEALTALHLAPSGATIGAGQVVELTATSTCAPAACPAALSYAWSTTSPNLGALTSESGPTVLFRAGQQAGSTAIVVNATLPDGSVLTAVAVISVTVPSPAPAATPVYANPYLWAGVIVVIGLICALLLLREARTEAPPPPPPRLEPWDEGPPGVEGPSPPAPPPSDRDPDRPRAR